MTSQAAASGGPAYLSSETRAPGTIRTNRLVIALIGLILLVCGVGAALLGFRVFGADRGEQPVLDPTVADFAERNDWFWLVVAVVALVVAYLCLRWLLAQGKSNRLGALSIGEDTSEGSTTVPASAFTGAVEREIEDIRGVQRASAHLSGSSTDPQLSVRIGLDGRVPTREVHRQVIDVVLRDARAVLATDSLPTRLEFTVAKASQRDIR